MSDEKDMWEKQYFKVIQRLGKGNKVEDLTVAVQLIINKYTVDSATPEQNAIFQDIVNEVKSLTSHCLRGEAQI